MDLINMVCPPGSGCPLNGFGLPEILLWVLAFAVIFGILMKLKIFSKAPTALISIATAFLVLMAVPAALIYAVSTMSTGLLIVAIGFITLMALIAITNTKSLKKVSTKDKDGNEGEAWQPVDPLQNHGTLMLAALIVISAVIFISAGGLSLLGIASLPAMLPVFSGVSWVIVLAGVAVLWMLSEAK